MFVAGNRDPGDHGGAGIRVNDTERTVVRAIEQRSRQGTGLVIGGADWVLLRLWHLSASLAVI